MQIYYKIFQQLLNTEEYTRLPMTPRLVTFFDSSCEETSIEVAKFFVHKNDTEIYLQGLFANGNFAILQVSFENSSISANNRYDFNNFVNSIYQHAPIRIGNQADVTIYPCI